MGNILLLVVTFIYIGVAIDFALKAQVGGCVTFLAYAIANVGLMLMSKNL